MGHENLARDHQVKASSDRAFGFVFAAVFAVIAAWPLPSGGGLRVWAAVIGGLFAGVAIVRPQLLAVLNRWWLKFGLLLGAIVSPVALGVLFYAVFAPIGLVMRLAGKDPLRLARDASAKSYWRGREPPGPPSASMDRQF